MRWRQEFSRDFDIPSFVEFLVEKKYLEDFSWHNDAMPSFGFVGTKIGRKHWDPTAEGAQEKDPETAITLWVDHPMMSQREVGGHRFAVMRGKYGEAPEDAWEFDELEEALTKLFEQIMQYGRGMMSGSAWVEVDPNLTAEELLNELEMEYHRSARD